MKNIYFDESGFTGYNFLDPSQPVFAIASADIDPELAKEILNSAFPRYNAPEFKFGNIVNSSNEPGIVELGKLLKPYTHQCYLYMINKKFVTLVKAVDFLMEPAITRAGYDFYKNGFCWKYANYIYIGMTAISKTNVYDEFVLAYQLFSRKPSSQAIKELKQSLKLMEKKVDLEIRIFFAEFILGCEILTDHFDLNKFKGTNDLQLTTMLAIVSYWRQNHEDDFTIIHDDSSNFLRHKETWDALTRHDVPEYLHPLGDGTFVQYPLRVIQTLPVKSQENYSVQLCDILAGFATQNFKNDLKGPDAKPIYKEAMEAGLGAIMYNSIRPGTEFPKFPPEKLTGPDAADLLAQIIKRAEDRKK